MKWDRKKIHVELRFVGFQGVLQVIFMHKYVVAIKKAFSDWLLKVFTNPDICSNLLLLIKNSLAKLKDRSAAGISNYRKK